MLIDSHELEEPRAPAPSTDAVLQPDFTGSKWTVALLLLFLVSLAIRLVFLFVAPNGTTDAWSRYRAALVWLRTPGFLPLATLNDAWLPLHFWLLGAVLRITQSEMGARFFSVVLGSLTVILFAGIVARTFDRRTAFLSSLLLAFYGFHIAFSVTTSSEALTLFLVVLGIYAWVRYESQRVWTWMTMSALALSAASLCRFEPWLCGPVLSVMLLDFSSGWTSAIANRRAWWQALGYGVFASAGALVWLLFSFLKWGDALELPHRTIWLNQHFQPTHHSMLFRLAVVPSSLLISLSPLVGILACLGIWRVLGNRNWGAFGLAALVLTLFAFNCWNSVKYEATQARYTLLYSWLLFPFAFEGLRWICERKRWPDPRTAVFAVVASFLLWQGGIIAGATYAPPAIADRLGALSPTIPIHHEMRELTDWLIANESRYNAIVLDDFNWDSPEVFRLAHFRPRNTFSIDQADYDDPVELQQRLDNFMIERHPDLLICSPEGPIGKLWSIDHKEGLRLEAYKARLGQLWSGEHWRVYRITYP